MKSSRGENTALCVFRYPGLRRLAGEHRVRTWTTKTKKVGTRRRLELRRGSPPGLLQR